MFKLLGKWHDRPDNINTIAGAYSGDDLADLIAAFAALAGTLQTVRLPSEDGGDTYSNVFIADVRPTKRQRVVNATNDFLWLLHSSWQMYLTG